MKIAIAYLSLMAFQNTFTLKCSIVDLFIYISLFKVIEECHLIKYSRFLKCPNLKTIFQRKGYNLVLPYYTHNSQNNPILKVCMLHG